MASWSMRSGGSSTRRRRSGAARRSAPRAAGARCRRCSGTTRSPPPAGGEPMISYRVGVDVGGTFTDIVLLGSDGTIHVKKVPSSVENYAAAIVDGLTEVFRETGLDGKVIEEIRHGKIGRASCRERG